MLYIARMIKNINFERTDEFNINIEILQLLSHGLTQKEVSHNLKEKGITPNSYSIIDKRLKAMTKEMKCKTVFQLMYKVGKTKLI